jgi:hypothetical protein
MGCPMIQEERGWLKTFWKWIKKAAGCPGKHRQQDPVSERSMQRFAEYNRNVEKSDDIEGSPHERGRPGGDEKLPPKRKRNIRLREESKFSCPLILSFPEQAPEDESLAIFFLNIILIRERQYNFFHSLYFK